MIRRATLTLSLTLSCGSSTTNNTSAPDASADVAVADTSSPPDASAVTTELTGMYGPDPIKPVVTGYWVGSPANPNESGGGPFLYFFSGPVKCTDLSPSGWLTKLPPVQVLEMIVGTKTTGIAVPAAAKAAPNVVEVNYATGGNVVETRATAGSVTLTRYTPGVAVEGMMDVTFPSGSTKGTFHAEFCATGNEL